MHLLQLLSQVWRKTLKASIHSAKSNNIGSRQLLTWRFRRLQHFCLLACCSKYLGPSRAYLNMAQTGDMNWDSHLAPLQAGQPDRLPVSCYLSRDFRGQQTRRASPWAYVPVMPAGLHVKPAASLMTGTSASLCC